MIKRTKSSDTARRNTGKAASSKAAPAGKDKRDTAGGEAEGKAPASGKNGRSRSKDVQSDRMAKLAQILAARLSYASYKVSKGWIQQNINEIENLHSSRFSKQAEDRRLLKGKGRASLPTDLYNTGASIFAEARNMSTGGLSTNRYQGYTSTYVEPDAEYASTSASAYPYAQDYYPSAAMQSQLVAGRNAETPPPHPSPSMYNYLASPLNNGSGPWQGTSASTGFTPRLGGPIRPDSRVSERDFVVSSGLPMSYEDFSQTSSRPASTAIPQYGIRDPNNGLMVVDHALGTPGVASQSSTGFLSVQGGTQQQYAQPYSVTNGGQSLLPPAGIAQASRQGGKVGQLAKGHARGPSVTGLRGEYSASNITMDDLDWHFQ